MTTTVQKEEKEGKYIVRFSLEGLTENESSIFKTVPSFSITIPTKKYYVEVEDELQQAFGDLPTHFEEDLEIELKKLNQYRFLFRSPNERESFIKEVLYAIKANEEVLKIAGGARKALDKNSREYKEIIEKNREAFEKLSKL
ncbi:MAG: hypothetical protein HY033_07935 [Ignavibacteriae bacterium]|nr:hypothetical protein [Ignavibacteria bacterium]MBI3364821.1 hypothetical protein [Ignavibacteriota bacterium]